ncbi:DUF1534 domain-containing protein [Pseudomonas syringae USA011]|nr:DUF1534 domain-containing protein [Pseudomonas syringae USA011]
MRLSFLTLQRGNAGHDALRRKRTQRFRVSQACPFCALARILAHMTVISSYIACGCLRFISQAMRPSS